MNLEEKLVDIITSDNERCWVLQAVADLGLPNAWIAGGYIRNPVWNHIFNKTEKIEGSDVDVVYFKSLDSYGIPEDELIQMIRSDTPDPVRDEEETACAKLKMIVPGLEYEVKNQGQCVKSIPGRHRHIYFKNRLFNDRGDDEHENGDDSWDKKVLNNDQWRIHGKLGDID